ncbi:hypothetical protein E3P89_04090, partial [Wallemia ichthyophaga]
TAILVAGLYLLELHNLHPVPTCRLPVENDAFVDFAGNYISPAFGVSIGYNYFLCMIGLLCFEITNFGNAINYWTTEPLHPAIMVSASIAAYVLIHSWDSRWFGESEFVVDRSLETLIAGNVCIVYFSHYVRRKSPQWRLWIQILARPWSNSVSSSAFGASFAVAGPDMLSIISGEARDPRRVMPIAFRTVFVWLFVFFILSTLAVGIVISSEDKILLNSIKNNGAGAAQSLYGASMMRLKIKRLPHLVNASITTSIFSAGSAFFFNSLRTLHGLAVQGFGPVIFKRVNRNGVPYATIFVTTAFACLSYLKIGNGSSKVLDWFIGERQKHKAISTADMRSRYLYRCATDHLMRYLCNIFALGEGDEGAKFVGD